MPAAKCGDAPDAKRAKLVAEELQKEASSSREAMPSDDLVDIFCFLQRDQLDTMKRCSRRINKIISLRLADVCFRVLTKVRLVEGTLSLKLEATSACGRNLIYGGDVVTPQLVASVLRSSFVRLFEVAGLIVSSELTEALAALNNSVRMENLAIGTKLMPAVYARLMPSETINLTHFFTRIGTVEQVYLKESKYQLTNDSLFAMRPIGRISLGATQITCDGILAFYFVDQQPAFANRELDLAASLGWQFTVQFVEAMMFCMLPEHPFILTVRYNGIQDKAGLEQFKVAVTPEHLVAWKERYVVHLRGTAVLELKFIEADPIGSMQRATNPTGSLPMTRDTTESRLQFRYARNTDELQPPKPPAAYHGRMTARKSAKPFIPRGPLY